MATDNVEIARRGYRAFEQGGVEAILEFLDPEIEWHMSAVFTNRSRVFRGHDGVRDVFGSSTGCSTTSAPTLMSSSRPATE
jgi:ketosteroid isomerase-like protein